MRDRYDFSKGVLGKYAAGRVRSGVFHIIEEGADMPETDPVTMATRAVGVTITDDDNVRLIMRDPDKAEDALEFVMTPEQANKFAYALTACAAHASNRAMLKAQATQGPSDA
jgi:hypothetical protein